MSNRALCICLCGGFAALLLAGCVAVDETRVAPGIYDLATPANGQINTEDRARVILDARGRALCPMGYDRVSERLVTDAAGRETMIRRIACRRRDQTPSPFRSSQ